MPYMTIKDFLTQEEQEMRKNALAMYLGSAKGYSNDAINYPETATVSRQRAMSCFSAAERLGFIDC